MYRKLRVHPSRLAITLLKAIGTAGAIVAVLALPGLGIVVREIQKSKEREERKRAYQSLQYLRRRGHVTLKYLSDGKLKVKLTRKGNSIVKQLEIKQLTISRPPVWDNIWRIIIFDVPNWKSKNRQAFTDRLKHLGFMMIQKSVWVYPYPCHGEIMILRKYYDIERHVVYLETAYVEDEHLLRQRFSYLKLA